MLRFVALLRGINVGGNSMIKMDELKAVFGECGFENVRSYINSGNIAFDTSRMTEPRLTDKIEHAIARRFGREVAVMVREQRDIARIIAANPFNGAFDDHKRMHVLFLKAPLSEEKLTALMDAAPAGEGYETIGREVYCHLPNGVIDSLMGKNFFEKKLKVSATARNWRTVEKLAVL